MIDNRTGIEMIGEILNNEKKTRDVMNSRNLSRIDECPSNGYGTIEGTGSFSLLDGATPALTRLVTRDSAPFMVDGFSFNSFRLCDLHKFTLNIL